MLTCCAEDGRLRDPNTSSTVDHKTTALSVARRMRQSRLPHPCLHRRLSSKHCHQSDSRRQQRHDAGRRVCRKYRQVYIRSLQQQEYNKLLNIVPVLASSRHKKRIPKVCIHCTLSSVRFILQFPSFAAASVCIWRALCRHTFNGRARLQRHRNVNFCCVNYCVFLYQFKRSPFRPPLLLLFFFPISSSFFSQFFIPSFLNFFSSLS